MPLETESFANDRGESESYLFCLSTQTRFRNNPRINPDGWSRARPGPS